MDTTIDVGSVAEIRDLYRNYLSKGKVTVADLLGSQVEIGSEGAWVTMSDGTTCLNCGGYGVFITGARHPIVMDAVLRQLHTHPVSTRILLEPTVARAAEALCSVAPAGLERVHFALGGAEAVETGIKMARAHGKWRLASFHGGYHGKSCGALSVTAKEMYQAPFRPLLPEVTHLPYGDADSLEELLAAYRGEVCVIVEPVQGEGGVIIPPVGFLRRVEKLCREHDAFFVLDEIQTGMGRLGEWWGADLDGIVPDVLLAGKSLGGGVVPVSAAVATRRAFAPFDKDPYIHTATFSGAPLLIAAVQGTRPGHQGRQPRGPGQVARRTASTGNTAHRSGVLRRSDRRRERSRTAHRLGVRGRRTSRRDADRALPPSRHRKPLDEPESGAPIHASGDPHRHRSRIWRCPPQ